MYAATVTCLERLGETLRDSDSGTDSVQPSTKQRTKCFSLLSTRMTTATAAMHAATVMCAATVTCLERLGELGTTWRDLARQTLRGRNLGTDSVQYPFGD